MVRSTKMVTLGEMGLLMIPLNIQMMVEGMAWAVALLLIENML
ncbi:hypothetical protein [Brevibacillus laterosporus]|nr:hypothetical protein [Brevibacillus laterosporus]